jgi:hypothetical protein
MEIDFQGRRYAGEWVEKILLGPRAGQAVEAPCDNPLTADHPANPGFATRSPGPDPVPEPFDVYGVAGAGADKVVVSKAPDGDGYWIWFVPHRVSGWTERDGVVERVHIEPNPS